MLSWIIAAIVLYYIGLFTPSLLTVGQAGFAYGIGPRDMPPPDTQLIGRAKRAHENFKENAIPFFAVAILTLLLSDPAPTAQAMTGAAVWVISRALYIPLYLAGVPWIRSLAYFAGWGGLVMMILSLL